MSISAVSSSHYSTAVTDNRDRYSGSSCNPFRGGISDNAEDGMSGIPRDDHGSVDDIEHFFISADDWDRSQFTGTTRFNYEQHSAGEEDYIYGSASSASEGNTAVYVDSSIKDIYPFLSTPTPTSPQSHTVQTSPAPTERTSSLPLPSAQSNFYSNARQSSGILDSVGAVAVNDATLQFVEFGPKLHDDMSYQAVTNHTGSLDGWSDGHERGAQRHPDSFLRSQSIHQLIAADNKTGKKGQKVKLSKPLQDLYPDQEAATNVKCKQKKPRTVSIDHLLADPTIGSSRNSNLGPLESFLSSNYFIKESLNEQMGPFFLQQSLHCHPKAPSLQELMSGAAAATTTTTTGVGTTPSGLTANGKKRYRKHPASISASKIKQEAQLIAQIADRNFRNQTLMDKKPQSSATACATNIYQQQTDNNMMLSSICDRGISSRNYFNTFTNG